MIYPLLKRPLLAIMKAPAEPPEPPAGSPNSVQTFRASRQYLMFNIVSGLALHVVLFLGLIIFGVIFGFQEPVAGYILIGLAFLSLPIALLNYCMIKLDYDMRYYIVTDRSLRIREGIWTIRESTYTFANVQNLSINQGPVERMLGFASLRIHTAGGASVSPETQGIGHQDHTGTLRGIANAQEVRDQIQQLLRRYRDAGLGDQDDKSPAKVTAATGFSPAACALMKQINSDLRRTAELLSA